MLAAGGYVGLTQIRAAEDRADARAQTVESVKAAAEAKVFQDKATALAGRLPHPTGFTPAKATATNPCSPGLGGVAVCLDTTSSPRPALDAYLKAVGPLGLVVKTNDCNFAPSLSSRARAIFGNTPPCSAFGTLSGLNFTATSFPKIDHARSTKGHVVFSGTRVSFGFFHV